MMQFYLSNALVKPLAKHLKPARRLQPDLIWRADIAQIGPHSCVVAQEMQSQYIMVLCGLDADDFYRFPELFQERFWKELAAICKQAGVYDTETLVTLLSSLADEQHYQQDSEPQEEGRLSRTIEKLERGVLYENEPLPLDGRSAFEFGYAINARQSKADRANGTPSPAETLGNICLTLMEDIAQRKREMTQQPEPLESLQAVTSVENNIIKVDFSRR